MIENRTRPRRLAATTLAVVLAASGCGTTDPASDGVPEARAAAGQPGGGHVDLHRPTVAHLDPDLLEAVEDAARDAEDDGVRIQITSGWRSPAHQQRLFDEAVRKYGSEEEALRYVAPPDVSAHVTGDAVDIGPTTADTWLSAHGADYGLCQIFANEIWHFELATTPGGRCPDLLPDSSARTQRPSY